MLGDVHFRSTADEEPARSRVLRSAVIVQTQTGDMS